MIERYPRDLSISYVTSHERRHAVSNELTALAKNMDVDQHISYKVSISKGRLIALQGITEAEFSKGAEREQGYISSGERNISINSEDEEYLAGKDDIKTYLEITRLNHVKESYENHLREIKRGESKDREPGNMNIRLAFLQNEIRNMIHEKNITGEVSNSSPESEIEKLKIINEIMLIDGHIDDIEWKKRMNEVIEKGSKYNPESLETGLVSGQNSHDIINEDNKNEHENRRDFIRLREGINEITAKSFWFMEKEVPGAFLIDSAGSAIKTRDTLKELGKIPVDSPVTDKTNFGSRFLDLKLLDFEGLSKNLLELEAGSARLSEKESFNIHRGSTANSDIIEIRAGFGSRDGTYKIQVKQLARGQQIASDEFTDPSKALSLTGEFSINGFKISVTSSNSLNDIKDMVNFGEDTNKNGKLDLAEDLNKNGTIDSFFIKGTKTDGVFLNPVSIFEDINSDRELDSGEDTNNNELLDGGSGKINVMASIERNRLILTSTLYGDKKIRMSDTDGILLSLGFFQLDGRGIQVQKEQQLLSDGVNLNKDPQKAVVTVNGTRYEKNTNTITDIISDTALILKKESHSEIKATISSDTTDAFNNIKKFVDSFNKTLNFINDQIISDKMLNKDEKVQNMRSEMIHNAHDEIRTNEGNNHISEIGIEDDKSERRNFHQLSLMNLLMNLKEQLLSLPSRGGNSIFTSLDEVGITSISNDTLKINEDRLTDSLKKDINKVHTLLSGVSDSVTVRIERQLESALNPKIGALKFRKDVIDYYKRNQNVINDFLKDKENISKSRVENKTNLSMVSKVT
jgi:flagellar capping protein FliD